MHINWRQMERMEGMRVVAEIMPHLKDVDMKPAVIRVRQAKLAFYDQYVFYELTDPSQNPQASIYALHKPGCEEEEATLVLDGTNRPIYTANEWAPLILDAGNIPSYVGFFFACVVGTHGPMAVVEKLEDMTPEKAAQEAADQGASPQEQEKMAERVRTVQGICPPRVLNIESNGIYTVAAAMLFQNCIFRTKMEITTQGLIRITEHDMMIGGMDSADEED
ncbi:MAG: hypothetical protein IPI58_09600 [Alphaproteobacteria bacterium]|nr:MAG: hypothetical protein IPI58_09600 [Alphaproteobacteria bacterium]